MSADPRSNLAGVLDLVDDYIADFVFFESDEQRWATTLWVFNTHVFERWDSTPYLWISSPERGSGKSRLLEVLEVLARSPMLAANISPAAFYRSISERRPTLLFDEIDTVFGRGRSVDSSREELRGLLDAGWRKGTTVLRMGGPRGTQLQEFDVFCPKALAGIGGLPDTIADRSIPIRLQRKPPASKVKRFRRREVERDRETIPAMIEAALAPFVERLNDPVLPYPVMPPELRDRAEEAWEPLIAVSDLAAGSQWPIRARRAALAIGTGVEQATDTTGIRLLADLRIVFDGRDRISTKDLLDGLHRLDESPWNEWFGGRPIGDRFLGDHLRSFRISSRKIRFGDLTLRGYERADFVDTWERYLSPEVGTSGTSGTSQSAVDDVVSPLSDLEVEQLEHVPGVPEQIPISGSSISPTSSSDVPDVPADERDKEPSWRL